MLTLGPLQQQIRAYNSSQHTAYLGALSDANPLVCCAGIACTEPVLGAVEIALASLPLTNLYDWLSFPSAAHLLFLHINKYTR